MPTQELSSADRLALGRSFRFAVALLVLVLLWWFLMNVLERETRRAEAQAANLVMNQLRAALVIKGAEVMLSRRERLEDQKGINPFELLDHHWSSYQGVCRAPTSEPGTWCFWRSAQNEPGTDSSGWLIYTPNQPITLNGRRANAGEALAWVVTTEFADRNKNGRREHQERSTGLRLAPVSLKKERVPSQDAGH